MATPKIDSKVLRGLRALVIDDQPPMRQLLKSCLLTLEVTQVLQAGTGEEAVKLLGKEKVDLVLCDYNLGAATDGQQLLEYVRSKGLVSNSVIWLMVTAEMDRRRVTAAGEVAPDGYLAKPFSARSLDEKLLAAIELKNTLKPVVAAMERQDFGAAAAAAGVLIDKRGRYTLEAMRLKTECLLQTAKWDAAKAVCSEALAINDRISWAELGLARALRAEGDLESARSTVNVALGHRPELAAGWDLLIDVLLETGQQAEALEKAKEAVAALPTTRRNRSVAVLAAAEGDAALAASAMEKVVASTRTSLTRKSSDTGLLAKACVDSGQPERALSVLAEAPKEFLADKAFAAAKAAAECRAHTRLRDTVSASAALQQVREIAAQAELLGSDVQLAMAEAAFEAGDRKLGRELVSAVIASNHEHVGVVGEVRNLLANCGMAAEVESLVNGPIAEITGKVNQARQLLKEGRMAEAIDVVEAVNSRLPSNVEVLLTAAQVHIVAMRRLGTNSANVTRLREYLARVEAIAPENSRYLLMRAAFRDLMTVKA